MAKVGSSALQAATQVVTGVITSSIAKNQEKKRQEMINHFKSLSEKQQIEIANKLESTKNFYEQQRLLFQALAVEKNKELMAKTDKDKIMSFVFIGVGVLILGSLIFISRKK